MATSTPKTPGKRALIKLCLGLPGSYEDYPFRDDNWAAVRHGAGGRIFALIYKRNGKLCINLKCEPMQADFWRSVYESVAPGYHMNHTHWNTVSFPGDVPMRVLKEMVHHSYGLTQAQGKRSSIKNAPP